MAHEWTNDDFWTETDPATKVTKGLALAAEISNAITANITSGGTARDSAHLIDFLKTVLEELDKTRGDAGTVSTTSPRVRSGFTRGVPV
jgi:hypothetical protein